MKMSRTVTRSQPLFGTFDEETVIRPKEVKERRKNTTVKNVLGFRVSEMGTH